MQEIICILDKSGSMRSFADDAIKGFNDFLDIQKEAGEAHLTLVWFDHKVSFGYEGSLLDTPPLNEWPGGGRTALLDAIGKTFSHLKKRHDDQIPENVIIAIMTDGFENASRKYEMDEISDLIDKYQDQYDWKVYFLAADQDAWETAKNLSIKKSYVSSYKSSSTKDALKKYSTDIIGSRIKY